MTEYPEHEKKRNKREYDKDALHQERQEMVLHIRKDHPDKLDYPLYVDDIEYPR